MTALDVIILFLLTLGAFWGFRNGFVEEVLALMAWTAAIMAIRLFHGPVSTLVENYIGNEGGASVLALLGLFLLTYFTMRLLASSIGKRSRSSLLGPIDRALGAGFGALKLLLIATLGYLLVLTVHTTIWPEDQVPQWASDSRTYPLLNASSQALSDYVAERQKMLAENLPKEQETAQKGAK